MPLKPLKNEHELLQAIATGDQQAFAALFYGYQHQLGKYAGLITGSHEAAQEIVQDIFLKIWEDRNRLPEINNFNNWLFILSRNRTLESLRKTAREEKTLQSYTLKQEQHTTEPDAFILDPTDYHPLIQQAVDQLPAQQKKVFQLKQQGKKSKEIATELGIAQDSVRKYQQWALLSIRKFLESHAELGLILLLINGLHNQ